MNFKDKVEAVRPNINSEEEKQNAINVQNKEICDYVIKVAKEKIINKAKKLPKNGQPLNLISEVYLGLTDDCFIKSIIDVFLKENTSFWGNKTYIKTYSVSQNGESLLKKMQTLAEKDGIMITKYLISFGRHARSDNEEMDSYVCGRRLTNLYDNQLEELPLEIKWKDHGDKYLSCPRTNGAYEKMKLYDSVGLYVQFLYLG